MSRSTAWLGLVLLVISASASAGTDLAASPPPTDPAIPWQFDTHG